MNCPDCKTAMSRTAGDPATSAWVCTNSNC